LKLGADRKRCRTSRRVGQSGLESSERGDKVWPGSGSLQAPRLYGRGMTCRRGQFSGDVSHTVDSLGMPVARGGRRVCRGAQGKEGEGQQAGGVLIRNAITRRVTQRGAGPV